MWVAHHTAVSQWLWRCGGQYTHNPAPSRDKWCSPCNLASTQGTRNLVEHSGPEMPTPIRNQETISQKFRNPAKMWKTSTSVIFFRHCSMARRRGRINLIPVTTLAFAEMPGRLLRTDDSLLLRGPLNLRHRVQPIGDEVCVRKGQECSRRLIQCSASSSNGTDATVVSNEEEAKTVPANTLEYVHKVALDVVASPDLVWKLWTDIKSAPQWMRWIDRVEFLAEDGTSDLGQELPPGLTQLSRWICSTAGFEVMWVARVEHVESAPPVRVLRWATVEGLQSRGEVTIKENNNKGTTVELSISHSLPAALGRVMHSSALRGLVQATLQSDLECFQKYAAEAVSEEPKSFSSNEDGSADGRGGLTITTDCSPALEDPL